MSVFQERRKALATNLREAECDGFLTTHSAHVRWLTGFNSSNAGVLIAADGSAKISTDGRYTVQVGKQAPDLELITARACGQALVAEAVAMGITQLGIESDLMTLAEFRALEDSKPHSVELVETERFVGELRLIKSEDELQALRDVAAIAVRAFESLVDDRCVRAGVTEREVAAELEYRMRRLGADGPSFDTIVASGPNSAKPHHGAEDRVLETGDLVTIDFGAIRDGYNSDKTRTLFVGGAEAATEKTREIYNIVHDAQAAGILAARVGAKLVDVDKACRDVITKAGYGEYFVHSTGHGIGIDVHEAPIAGKAGTGELKAGMTLTIEPGIYIPNVGGVRIEDTLIITDEGPEIITPLAKPRA